MTDIQKVLLSTIVTLAALFVWQWWQSARRSRAEVQGGAHERLWPTPLQILIGFVVSFFQWR